MPKLINSRRVIFLLLILVGICCYANILKGDFVWDDFLLVVDNPLVSQAGHTGRIFISEIAPYFDYYRPLQILSYRVDYLLYGLRPAGFHLSSIIIHIINSILVFLIIRLIAQRFIVAALASLLFVASPVHVEAVSYISSRADLLLALFLLAAFLCYLKRKFFSSGLFFILALLSKEQALVFPFTLVIFEICIGKKMRENSRRIGIFFLSGALYLFLRTTFLNFSQEPLFYRMIYFSPEVSFPQRLLAFIKSLTLYLQILIFPVGLHMERRIDPVNNFSWFYLLFLFSLLIFIWRRLKLDKAIPGQEPMTQGATKVASFAFIWFLLMLFPQSSFFFPKILAEHFLYLPSIGFFLLLALLLERLWKRNKEFGLAIFLAIAVYYAALTIAQNQNWQAPLKLYRWTLQFSPGNHKVNYALANYYIRADDVDAALPHYLEAAKTDPIFLMQKINHPALEKYFHKDRQRLATFYHDLGQLLSRRGLGSQAEDAYRYSMQQWPLLIENYNDLGCLYLKASRYEEAEAVLAEGINLNPHYAKIYYNLGVIFALKDDYQKAIYYWKKALEVDPRYTAANEAIKQIKDVEK